MKLIRPDESPLPSDRQGYSPARPHSQDWRREWIENQPRRVQLECGCVEDLHDRTLLIINSFDGCTVLCERCDRFVSVVGPYRKPAIEYPVLPSF